VKKGNGEEANYVDSLVHDGFVFGNGKHEDR